MTIARFLATLPSNPTEALAQIIGALAYDGIGHRMSPDDRAELLRAQERIQRRRK